VLRIILALIGLLLAPASQSHAQNSENPARIGVLAYLGYEDALARWHGLKLYLDAAVPDYTFELVPVTLASASRQLASGQLDFLVTNPGHFVDLSEKHEMSVIASRNVQQNKGGFSSTFGSLIFARRGTDITSLSDARGKSVVTVGKNAFGGFQLAWREFQDVGINLFTDTSNIISVGFPMDTIVTQVASGRADIGIVRSGLMERLLSEGYYKAGDFIYLNTSATFDHADRVSTRLYPEWPFAALAQTPSELRDPVALALLNAKNTPLAQKVRLRYYWTAPVSYQSVVELNEAYTKRIEELGLARKLLRSWPLLLGTVLLPLVALVLILRWRIPISAPHVNNNTSHPTLTKREREVLDLIAEGYSSKEIARKLAISPKTVEFHRANLLKKYEARSSSQLVALAS
jgi:two-component system, LuxR family, sensor histidine kinase TtrS